jgi:hypothetical protein
MNDNLIDPLSYVDVYKTLPKYVGKHAEIDPYAPRMPGYSLPRRTNAHWFMLTKERGDWFGKAIGSLFNKLTVRDAFPVTRLLILIRRSGRDA